MTEVENVSITNKLLKIKMDLQKDQAHLTSTYANIREKLAQTQRSVKGCLDDHDLKINEFNTNAFNKRYPKFNTELDELFNSTTDSLITTIQGYIEEANSLGSSLSAKSADAMSLVDTLQEALLEIQLNHALEPGIQVSLLTTAMLVTSLDKFTKTQPKAPNTESLPPNTANPSRAGFEKLLRYIHSQLVTLNAINSPLTDESFLKKVNEDPKIIELRKNSPARAQIKKETVSFSTKVQTCRTKGYRRPLQEQICSEILIYAGALFEKNHAHNADFKATQIYTDLFTSSRSEFDVQLSNARVNRFNHFNHQGHSDHGSFDK